MNELQTQNQNQKRKRKGFTLIELIIVLAVMAIIAAIAIPNFAAVRDSSKKKADTQSCETIKRTVLTLVADDTIKPDKSLTFNSGASFIITKEGEVEKSATLADGYSFTGTWADSEKIAIAKMLKDVKAPQLTDSVKYTASIDASGNVTVKTDSTGVEAK